MINSHKKNNKLHTSMLVFKDYKIEEQTQKIRNKYRIAPLHVVRNQEIRTFIYYPQNSGAP